MDALEGRGNVGISGIREMNTKSDPVESLLAAVRRELDMAVNDAEDRFDALRAELVFQRVMARVEEDRRRGFWALRALWLLRMMTAARGLAAVVWNSRAVRLLVP